MTIPTVLAASALAEADVQKVVDAFHAGLKAGDTVGVMALLASKSMTARWITLGMTGKCVVPRVFRAGYVNAARRL